MRALALAAVVVSLLSGSAPAAQRALPRATSDRADAVQGPQLHVVYAIPSDGTDRALDTSGAIESSVASFQRWLAAETGGSALREDTYQGSLDITFARLPRTDAEIGARGAFVRDELESLLRASGLIVADKLYAVYYDGSSTFSCGGGAWPPALPGVVGAMYLHGRPPGAPPCDSNALAAPGAAPGYIDYAMLHELLHTLGAVPTCAPHHHRAGHISDRADDIMWAGTAAWQIPGRLDPDRDDYYGHGRSDCFDLARSPYLTRYATTPKVTIRSFRAQRTARQRQPFQAVLEVEVDGAPPATGTAACVGRLGARPFNASVRFVAGTARCTWRVPAGSRGRVFRGTVRATVGDETVARGFVRVVR